MGPKLYAHVIMGDLQSKTEDLEALIKSADKHFKTSNINDVNQSENISVVINACSSQDLYNQLIAMDRKDITVNFIGNLKPTKETANILLTVTTLIGPNHSLFYTDFTNHLAGEIVTREIRYSDTTLVLQSLTDYKVPEDLAGKGFIFDSGLTRAGILMAIQGEHPRSVEFVKSTTNPDEPRRKITSDDKIYINVINQVIILDNGQDGEQTAWLNQLSSIYRNVKIRTQLSGEFIEFVRFTPREDSYLRLEDKISAYRGFLGIHDSKIFKEGYVSFDPTVIDEDDDAGGYVISEKGINYRLNNQPRKSVRFGIAIGDLIIDVRTGIYHEVMSYDINTGDYALMAEDMSQVLLDIRLDNYFYHVNQSERDVAAEKLA